MSPTTIPRAAVLLLFEVVSDSIAEHDDWHTHEHNHNVPVHSHDHSQQQEEAEHGTESHVHDHAAPAQSPA